MQRKARRSENMGTSKKLQIFSIAGLKHSCEGAVGTSQILNERRCQAKHFRRFSQDGYGKLSRIRSK